MFAEAAGWNRPIRFTGGAGGHMAALDVAREAREHRVKRLVFAHIGRPSLRAIDAGCKPPFGEWGQPGRIYQLLVPPASGGAEGPLAPTRVRRQPVTVLGHARPRVAALGEPACDRAHRELPRAEPAARQFLQRSGVATGAPRRAAPHRGRSPSGRRPHAALRWARWNSSTLTMPGCDSVCELTHFFRVLCRCIVRVPRPHVAGVQEDHASRGRYRRTREVVVLLPKRPVVAAWTQRVLRLVHVAEKDQCLRGR